MPDPVLSVCIVLYHSEGVVEQALECLQQATTLSRVYLCDNSPEDHCGDRLAWRFPGVKVLTQKKNVGFGRANNAVLPYLTSKYHLIMNPDITFEPHLLQHMIDYMDAHPGVAILTPKVLNPDGSEQFLPKKQISFHYLLGGFGENYSKICRKWRREFTLADQNITSPIPVAFATGCFLLIRTEVFQTLNGFDPRFFLYQEDSDLSRRVIYQRLGSIIYHPDFTVTHLWARENTHSFKGFMRQVRSIIKYWWKWRRKR